MGQDDPSVLLDKNGKPLLNVALYDTDGNFRLRVEVLTLETVREATDTYYVLTDGDGLRSHLRSVEMLAVGMIKSGRFRLIPREQ